MADVAKLAGVSQQTVSRVINGSAGVHPRTRERVSAAVKLLDYQPNTTARALATGRSRTLGVVRVDTALYAPASTLYGIERAAHAAGYAVSVASRALEAGSTMATTERLRSSGVDGILVIAPRREAIRALRHLRADLAVVTVDGWPDDGLPGVATDRFAAARLATRRLLDLGHRRVAHLAGPAESTNAQQYIRGWRSALAEAGAAAPPVLWGDWSVRSGHELAARILDQGDVTAVFAANDHMALGLLRRLHETGLDVPGDISVIGVDDAPEAAYLNPPLTTVRSDFLELGTRSVALLLREIVQRGEAARDTVSPVLVKRESAAQPPSGHSRRVASGRPGPPGGEIVRP
jgi:DNA-binding LacI/PurR family transcriptional regulator